MTRRHVLRAQGSYFVVTGLWPIIHMASFEAVTGPKVDDWLVKMVGLLAAVIGGTLYLAAQRARQTVEILGLAISTAMAFTIIDIWYSLAGRISPIYLADAVVELGIVACCCSSRMSTERRTTRSHSNPRRPPLLSVLNDESTAVQLLRRPRRRVRGTVIDL